MFFRIEGEEAKPVFERAMKLLDAGTKALDALAKKWDWEAHAIEAAHPVSELEMDADIKLRKLEYDARRAKAMADLAEATVRQRRAALQQENLQRVLHKPRSSPRSNHERRNAVEGRKEEGKPLTQNLGDKLKSATPAS